MKILNLFGISLERVEEKLKLKFNVSYKRQSWAAFPLKSLKSTLMAAQAFKLSWSLDKHPFGIFTNPFFFLFCEAKKVWDMNKVYMASEAEESDFPSHNLPQRVLVTGFCCSLIIEGFR